MKLIVCPLHAVEAACRAHAPSHVVSLASPDAPPAPPVGRAAHLALRFNDIAAPRLGLAAPGPDHVAALLDFAAGWDEAAPLLIHCWAGVSRSTAAAYVLACARVGPGGEDAWALRLRAAAPFATPNPLLVALADARLGREGAMVRAVAAIGRGAETGLGRLFELVL